MEAVVAEGEVEVADKEWNVRWPASGERGMKRWLVEIL